MKRFLILALLCIIIVIVAACQPNPDKAIVVNKGDDNLNNLIEQNNNESFYVDTATWKEDFKIYESHYAEVPMHVYIDAVVRVPDTDSFPVANIKHRSFNKSDLKTLTGIFFNGDIKIAGNEYMTTEEINQAIVDAKQTIHKLQNNPELHGEGTVDQLEYRIKEYEHMLSNSKEFSQLSDVNWDKIDNDPVYIALASLTNGKSSTIFVGNSENSGESRMVYFDNKYDYLLDSHSVTLYQPFNDTPPKGIQMGLSQAKDLADNVAATLDKDMRYYGYCICPKEQIENIWESEIVDKECYVLNYTRLIQNVPITYASQSAQYSGEYGEPWDYEFMSFYIDDTGIIAFIWENPKQVSQIVNNNVSMLPFESIQDYSKQQISIINASMNDFSDYYESTSIKIDRIELGMTIIKKKDTDGEYMAIPVWDFFGSFSWTYTDKAMKEWKEPNKTYDFLIWPDISKLTINAIDGSIIDRSWGY